MFLQDEKSFRKDRLMAEKNEIKVAFSDQLSDKLISVEEALPRDFNRERFIQNCLAVMNEKPELAKINRAEVIQGLIKAAYLGLDFLKKECYLIPYGSSVQFQTDYKGECKFAKKYSTRPIKDIYAKVVRNGDTFEEKIVDGQPTIDFKPLPFSDAEIVGVFAVCLFEDGGMIYETMSAKDVQNVRNNYSKAANSKAWKYSFDEMAKKVCLRRLCKHIDTDFESIEAQKAWEDGSDFESNVINRPPSGEVVNVFATKTEVIEEDGTITEEVIDE